MRDPDCKDRANDPPGFDRAYWRALCLEAAARDIYLHRTRGVWSPFTREIEAATLEWLES